VAEETLALDLQENTAWAVYDMVSDVWYPAFLLIFLETTV
jgi:hypothetical protein